MTHDTRSKAVLTTEVGVWLQMMEQLPAPLRGVMRTLIEQLGRSAERFFTTAAHAKEDLPVRAAVARGRAGDLP